MGVLLSKSRPSELDEEERRNLVPPSLSSVKIPQRFIDKCMPLLYEPDGQRVVRNSLGCINHLSDNCAMHVLLFLNPKSLCSLSLVNKYWSGVSGLDAVWVQKCQERGWSTVKLRNTSVKSIYLSLTRELILTKAESQFASEFTYFQFLSTCHPPSMPPSKTIYIPKAPLVSNWERHPNDVNPTSPNDLVSDLDVLGYARFYLDFELKWLEYIKDHPFTEEQAQVALHRYVQFMMLKAKYPDHLLIPTQDILAVWISHLTRPDKYEFDCEQKFGLSYLPAIPVKFGPLVSLKQEALQSTADLWLHEYRESYINEEIRDETRFFNSRFVFKEGRLGRYSEQVHEGYAYIITNIIVPEIVNSDSTIKLSISENEILLDRQFIHNYLNFMNDNASYYNIYDTSPTIEAQEGALAINCKCYERFMYLIAKNPQEAHNYYPTYAADLIWHAHMLDPTNYRSYCQKYLGFILVHDPTGRPDPQTATNLKSNWEKEFKEEMQTGRTL